MLCCLGLFLGFAVGNALGSPWTFIGPAAGFGLGLLGDMKMHSSHGSHGGSGAGCCGGGHTHGQDDENDPEDPVCGMKVNEKRTQYTAEYKGKTYYFCSHKCMSTFKNDPRRYVR